jgi:DNA polymerase-3 subunit epsilon
MSYVSSIKKDGENIILYKCSEPVPELLLSVEGCVNIGFLDTETTGLDKQNNEIIELALKVVKLEEGSGKIVSIDHEFESFNNPGGHIDEGITLINGITDEMVKGKSIDWSTVDTILQEVDIIVSHNASFDRGFMDRYSTISQNTVWACTIDDIDWLARGFTNTKQELLCHWHGFYFDAHRAMNDVNALIHLVTHQHYNGNRPVLELIENARKPLHVIHATNFPYDEVKKDKIKANGYQWNGVNKIWFKRVNFVNLGSEKEWLTSIIYDTHFLGEVEEINLVDKYKI